MAVMDVLGIAAEHAARTAGLDPLLPVPPPLPDGALVRGGAAGAASFVESPEGSALRTWHPARRHLLDLRLAGPDQTADAGALLDAWLADLDPAAPGDDDCAAVVSLPSRDTAAVPALLARGFAPVSVAAVRRAAPSTPDPGVRLAVDADVPACAALGLALVEYDGQFGKVRVRPETEALLTDNLRYAVAAGWAWVAERDGRVAGVVTVQLPPDSAWVFDLTSVGPIGYLESMVVAPEHRGAGVGAALLTHAHAALDAVAPHSLLHHALPNPLSTPFWYRNGYRPLRMVWQRKPATRAG